MELSERELELLYGALTKKIWSLDHVGMSDTDPAKVQYMQLRDRVKAERDAHKAPRYALKITYTWRDESGDAEPYTVETTNLEGPYFRGYESPEDAFRAYREWLSRQNDQVVIQSISIDVIPQGGM